MKTILRKKYALWVLSILYFIPLTHTNNETAQGAFGGMATGALIGGLAGGGRGAGIGAAVGLGTGLIIGSSAEQSRKRREREDDPYYETARERRERRKRERRERHQSYAQSQPDYNQPQYGNSFKQGPIYPNQISQHRQRLQNYSQRPRPRYNSAAEFNAHRADMHNY